MILGRHRQPLVRRIEARALRNGLRLQDSVELQAEIEVRAPRKVALNDEPQPVRVGGGCFPERFRRSHIPPLGVVVFDLRHAAQSSHHRLKCSKGFRRNRPFTSHAVNVLKEPKVRYAAMRSNDANTTTGSKIPLALFTDFAFQVRTVWPIDHWLARISRERIYQLIAYNEGSHSANCGNPMRSATSRSEQKINGKAEV